ncbi:Isochorismatase hydrolase [Xylaria intraflava]|nr:Isochorismatase hydrolase [Xylaria intraflava]
MILLRATRTAAAIRVPLQPPFRLPAALPALRLGCPRLSSSMASSQEPSRRLHNPAIFVCDLQDKFRNAIWQFDKILLTTQKVLRAAQLLKIPIFVTTQNAKRLGDVVPELLPLIKDAALQADKTLFSMMSPEVRAHPFLQEPGREVVIVGIESHICVTQTTLDLLALGHRVYVLADGVSSCNEQEVPLALARLRAAGAVVTTSESWMFEVVGDAGIAEFKDFARLVKDTGADTKASLSGLLSKY